MVRQQQHELAAFIRTANFVAGRPHLTPDTAQGRNLAARVEALRQVARRIQALSATQSVASGNVLMSTHDEPELKRLLRSVHLRSIVDVARSLRKSVPGISVLTIPTRNAANATLISHVRAFITQARIYQSVLAEAGLPANAVDELEAALEAFTASVATRDAARGALSNATTQLRQEFAIAREIMEGLRGVMRRLLDKQPGELAAWRVATRVKTVRGAASTSTIGAGATSNEVPAAPLEERAA